MLHMIYMEPHSNAMLRGVICNATLHALHLADASEDIYLSYVQTVMPKCVRCLEKHMKIPKLV